MANLSKKRSVWTAIGTLVFGSSLFWRLIGRASDIDFLVEMGERIGPRMMGFLASWGWAISMPLGVLILFFSLRRPRVSESQVDSGDTAGVFAVREWIDLAKENDLRARELDERVRAAEQEKAELATKLARAIALSEKMMASGDVLSDSAAALHESALAIKASNEDLAKLAERALAMANNEHADLRAVEERFQAAYRTIGNMQLMLSDEYTELKSPEERITRARLYAWRFHEAVDFYLNAPETAEWPKVSTDAVARFRAIPKLGEPPVLLSEPQLPERLGSGNEAPSSPESA